MKKRLLTYYIFSNLFYLSSTKLNKWQQFNNKNIYIIGELAVVIYQGIKNYQNQPGTDKIKYTYDSTGYLVSMNLNSVEYYYISNIQGNITGILDEVGTQFVKYSYDTQGKLVSIDGTLKDIVGIKNPYKKKG